MTQKEKKQVYDLKRKAKRIVAELEPKISDEMSDKYQRLYEDLGRYMGNEIYSLGRHISTDTRALKFMLIADLEDIDYVDKIIETVDEVM